MASNNQKDDWQEVPTQSRDAAVDDWHEVNDWQETAPAKMKTGMEPGTYPVADAVSKGLNYLGNVFTTAQLSVLKRLVSEGQGLKDGGDMWAALKGQGKSAPKVLQESFGMNKLPAYLVGLPMEALADPLTHMPAAAKLLGKMELAQKLKAMSQPLASAMNAGGLSQYRKGFKAVDTDFAKFKGANQVGEHPFSDLAYDKGFLKSGMSPLDMEQAATNYREKVLGPQYNEIIDSPEVSAQRGNLTGALSQDTKDFLRDASSRSTDRPGAAKVAQQILEDAKIANSPGYKNNFYDNGERTPRQMLDLAKSYSDTARGTVALPGDIQKRGASVSTYKEGMMQYAQDLRDYVQKMAEKALPGSQDKIQDLNRQYQILKTAGKPLLQKGIVEGRKLSNTQADAALEGLSLLEAVQHSNPTASVILGAKKLGKYINSPSGRVRIGNTLKSASQTGIWDSMLRRGLLDPYSEDKE